MQQQEGVEPDPVTFPRIVIEYATVATLWGRQVYSWKFTQSGLDSDIFLSTCSDLIGLYAKYGSIEDSSAWSVFHNVSITLVVSWMPCLEHFPCRGMLRKHKCPFWADVSWSWRDLSSHFWFFGLSIVPHAGLMDEVLGYFDTEGKEFMLSGGALGHLQWCSICNSR
jgi:hypothetical protein